MDTYIINGKEVEFNTSGVYEMRLFNAEFKRANSILEARNDNGEDELDFVIEKFEAIIDFFDAVLGEGTVKQCFGLRPDSFDLMNAYAQFVKDVPEKFQEATKRLNVVRPATEPLMNREQRRAAEREARRQAIREQVKADGET